MPFLTEEDPNAKIRGARDPLGVVPIWSLLGRRLVLNLTTATTSIRGFTIVLLARYLTEILVENGRLPREEALAAFLRTEQMGAYARHHAHGVDGDIRGIERVKSHIAEGRSRVPIGTDTKAFILSDQKVYGLWGLYSVSARTSGLIADGPVGLTPLARDFIDEQYRPRFEPGLKGLLDLVERGGTLRLHGNDSTFSALAAVLPDQLAQAERTFYCRTLRDALETKSEHPGRQQSFAALLRSETDLDAPFGRAEAVHLAEAAAGVDPGLAKALEHVFHTEALLAPAAAVFDLILMRAGQHPRDVAGELRDRWGASVPNLDPTRLEELRPSLRQATRGETLMEMERCHAALRSGDYEAGIEALLAWNTRVTEDRKSAPWARLGQGGRIDVRYRGADQLLPDGDALGELWHNPYFIGSLKRIAHQIEASA